MNKNIVIPKNDVFFYGISLNSRDTDVSSDIFSNIIMKYLTTLKPVTGKLYRSADNAKYEYSYTFVPSKPLSWRVIKNRSVIEDIERMSDGKYCLNYYDDNGNDVKRVIFNNQHRWVKTNYYNSIYGESLVCSLIPKELNAETVILQYITGDPYPVTLRSCPTALNDEVLKNVLERCPTPDVTALTNYGLLYFVREETFNIFSQLLKEEEEKYKEAHKPPVFNTEEDVAGGFCFEVDNFDSTKTPHRRFDLSEAQELTDGEPVLDSPVAVEEFVSDIPATVESVDIVEEILSLPEEPQVERIEELSVVDKSAEIETSDKLDADVIFSKEYSIDDEIALAIKMISEATNININQEMILAEPQDEDTDDSDSLKVSDITNVPESDDIDSTILIIPEEPLIEQSAVSENTVIDEGDILVESDVLIPDDIIIDETIISDATHNETSEITENSVVPEVMEKSSDVANFESADLLKMDDDAIDDYVSSLIDNLLQGAHSTVNEYNLDKDDAFTAGNIELVSDISDNVDSLDGFVEKTPADSVIESNGAEYHYYGNLNGSGERTGRGRTLMSDGKLAYDGEYQDDMRHGKGSFYYKDGSLCFYGDWKENMRNGFGVGISSETGIIHTGSWRDNKPHGIGVRFDKEGNFMYLDSAAERTNGGVRVVGFGENSIFVEVWNEKTLKVVKKEISLDDLIN